MAIKANSTQEFVPIKEVREGIVILKNGGVRAILMASSINLLLKSSDEQQAVILQFQNFLNSLDFSAQIVIQSRKLDIRPYLSLLQKRLDVQEEMLMKIQTQEYMGFIERFADEVNIMTKNFFVVVPYTAPTLSKNSGVSSLLPFGKKGGKEEKEARFEEMRSQLDQRIATVQQGLSRLGVRSVQLGTEEVVELFYKSFNPGEIVGGMKSE